MAHAQRKFFDLHVSNKSQIAQQALDYIGQLYGVEREVKHLNSGMSDGRSGKPNPNHWPMRFISG